MAGGIFKGQSFYMNPKCVAFSFLMILLYWILVPDSNLYVLPVIAIGAYIAMAWYDMTFHCDTALESSHSTVTPEPTDHDEKIIRTKSYMRWVYFIHVLIIGPLLLYVGVAGPKVTPRVYGALLGMGVIAILYHGGKLVWG